MQFKLSGWKELKFFIPYVETPHLLSALFCYCGIGLSASLYTSGSQPAPTTVYFQQFSSSCSHMQPTQWLFCSLWGPASQKGEDESSVPWDAMVISVLAACFHFIDTRLITALSVQITEAWGWPECQTVVASPPWIGLSSLQIVLSTCCWALSSVSNLLVLVFV